MNTTTATSQTKKKWFGIICNSFRNSGLLFFLACLLLLAANISGCGRQDEKGSDPVIRLDKLSPLPETPKVPQPESQLRVAVAAILSPQGTRYSYQPFLQYLEKKTGKTVILIQRKTYQEINDLLARNVVNVAFVCTGSYFEGVRGKTMELLVVPQINGKITYQSLLIVPASSTAKSIKDLRGKVFAFTDPLSNTGYQYPISLLRELGEKPETFFSRTTFTYSHDHSIMAVMEGVADGAAVDNIIYNSFKKRDETVANKTKVIWQSPEFGMPPVVVPVQSSPRMKSYLKEIFKSANMDAEGQAALAEMGIERFVDPDPTLYSSEIVQ